MRGWARLGDLSAKPIHLVWLFGILLVVVLLRSEGDFREDEITYVSYARNLLVGHYAPEGSESLWCGPGYPLLVAACLAIGAPYLVVKILNCVLVCAAIAVLYRALVRHVGKRSASWYTLGLAAYLSPRSDAVMSIRSNSLIQLVSGTFSVNSPCFLSMSRPT